MVLLINACARPQSRTLTLATKAAQTISDNFEILNLFEEDLKPLDYNELSKREEFIEKSDFSDNVFRFAKHFREADEQSCYEKVKKLLDLLPPCYSEERLFRTAPFREKKNCPISSLLPKNPQDPYDVRTVIEAILDEELLEVQKEFAKNIIVGFGRLGGITVGVVANQTLEQNGSIDCDAADKAARFVQYCDCYNIPILSFVDSTGFVMEAEQEYKGLIRHGAKMVRAYADATTIRLTVILRKAYGGPYIFMGCKQLGADRHYVWPGAEVAVMKAEGAVAVISHNQLSVLEGKSKENYLAEQLENYKKHFMNSQMVLERRFVDKEIVPEHTRTILYEDLIRISENRVDTTVRKKHGNPPM